MQSQFSGRSGEGLGAALVPTVHQLLIEGTASPGSATACLVRQASFKGLREDRSATKVVEELPLSKKTAAKNGRRK